MRRSVLLLALAAAPVLSGCTVAFGVASVGRQQAVDRERTRAIADRTTLWPGEVVRLDRAGEPPLIGRWVRRPEDRAVGVRDTTRSVTLRIEGREVTLADTDIALLTRWPHRPSVRLWMLTGFTIDAAIGIALYRESRCWWGGCGDHSS